MIMVITQNPEIGRSRKSKGNTTFTSWKGKNVMKNKPLEVNQPNTEAQVAQKSRFAAAVSLSRTLAAIIATGYRQMAAQMTKFNAFVSENLKNGAILIVSGVVIIDYERLMLSKGTLSKTAFASIAADSSVDTVTVNFPTTSADYGTAPTDRCIVAAYNVTTGQWIHGTITAGARSTGQSRINGATLMDSNDRIMVYYFFESVTGASVSDSIAFEVAAS